MKSVPTKPKIENVGAGDIVTGHHNYWGYDAWLIRIYDKSFPLKPSKKEFEKVFSFRFDDIEEPQIDCDLFTLNQAREIVVILQEARVRKKNVVVHCFAGICRSGAVVKFAEEYLDFQPCGKFRLPNQHVKKLLVEAFKDETQP